MLERLNSIWGPMERLSRKVPGVNGTVGWTRTKLSESAELEAVELVVLVVPVVLPVVVPVELLSKGLLSVIVPVQSALTV